MHAQLIFGQKTGLFFPQKRNLTFFGLSVSNYALLFLVVLIFLQVNQRKVLVLMFQYNLIYFCHSVSRHFCSHLLIAIVGDHPFFFQNKRFFSTSIIFSLNLRQLMFYSISSRKNGQNFCFDGFLCSLRLVQCIAKQS